MSDLGMQRYAASDHSKAKPRTRDVGKEREGWMLRKEAVSGAPDPFMSGVLLAKGTPRIKNQELPRTLRSLHLPICKQSYRASR